MRMEPVNIATRYTIAAATVTSNQPDLSPPVTNFRGRPPAPVSRGGMDLRVKLQTVRQKMDRYRQLAAQGKWAEAGRELEAIDAELRK